MDSPGTLETGHRGPYRRDGHPGAGCLGSPSRWAPSRSIRPGGRVPRCLDRTGAIDTKGSRCRWDSDHGSQHSRRINSSSATMDQGPMRPGRMRRLQDHDSKGPSFRYAWRTKAGHPPGWQRRRIPWESGTLDEGPPGASWSRVTAHPLATWFIGPVDRPGGGHPQRSIRGTPMGRVASPGGGHEEGRGGRHRFGIARESAARRRRPGGMGNPKKFRSTPLT
jgi:hypothetical protein